MTTIIESSQIVGDEELTILIETDNAIEDVPDQNDPYGDLRDGFAEKPIQLARDLYDDAMQLANDVAIRTMIWRQKLAETDAIPDELELQFAIKMDAQWGAFLTRAGAEAQLQVTMKWAKDK